MVFTSKWPWHLQAKKTNTVTAKTSQTGFKTQQWLVIKFTTWEISGLARHTCRFIICCRKATNEVWSSTLKAVPFNADEFLWWKWNFKNLFHVAKSLPQSIAVDKFTIHQYHAIVFKVEKWLWYIITVLTKFQYIWTGDTFECVSRCFKSFEL